MNPPSREQWEFMKLEYQAIQQKIAATRDDIIKTETVYPIAITAIYAWLFTTQPTSVLLWRWALWLPVGIAVLGLVRIRARHRAMDLLESYCRRLELEFYGHTGLGWEHCYHGSQPMKAVRHTRHVASWVILMTTLGLAVVATWRRDAFAWVQERQAQTTKPAGEGAADRR